MLTIISILIFTFILFLILLFGKGYYDGIGLTKIEEEEEEEDDETSDDFYNITDRSSYFSDEVIDCEETIASSDTCVTIGQDLVTVSQYPMNGGKACTDKICKNTDVYDCRARGKERKVFIQRRSDNKFLNYKLVPCADRSALDDYVYDPPLSNEEIEEMSCKDTYIQRIQNSDGVSWDIEMDWKDYNVDGYASTWILKILPIDNSNRDSFQLYSDIKSEEYKLDTVIYLSSQDNVLSNKNNNITYDEKYFKTHISEGSDGINLICQEDNTQLIVYKPVFTACEPEEPEEPEQFVTFTGFNSKSKIKRNSDGKYLVISGPKLLKYYEDRANAENYEFQKVYDEKTHNFYYYTTDLDNRTSKHQFCFGGDNDHVSYTTNEDDATIFSINKEENNLKIKLEFEVTNFNITQGTTGIGGYESPHTVTKYIELLENGDLSLCDNYNFSTVKTPENSDIGPFGEITENFSGGWGNGYRSYNQYTPYQSDKVTSISDGCTVYGTDTKCFYGSSEPIDNSYSEFIQKYELVNIEKDDYTRQESTGNNNNNNNNCSNDVSEEKKACQIDYKKCISYDDFYSYHGNLNDYSFGKCVPKTSFLNKLSSGVSLNSDQSDTSKIVFSAYEDVWSPDLADIVTKKCDQLIECDEGMESSNIFNKNDMTKQFDYLIGLIPSGVGPATTQNSRNRAKWILENEMEPITYSQACTIKTE